MQPIATDGLSVGRSLCLSVTTVSPAKPAEQIEVPFWCAGLGWAQGTMGPDAHTGRGIFEGVKLGFSCTAPSTVPSGPHVGISPHAIDQRCDWPAAEAVECYIKFSQLKSSLRCGLSSKFFDDFFFGVAWALGLGPLMVRGLGLTNRLNQCCASVVG